MCAAQQLKRYYDPEDLCEEEWELNDEEIAALDLQGAASPMEVEGELLRLFETLASQEKSRDWTLPIPS